MSANDTWFIAFVIVGTAIGGAIGYWGGRKDANMRVSAHVDALYLVGQASAMLDPEGKVPWAAIRAALARMPHTYPQNQSALHRMAHESHDIAEKASGPALPDDGPHQHLPDSTQHYEEGGKP